MKFYLKRTIALCLAVVFILVMIVGCGKSETEKNVQKETSTHAEKGGEQKELLKMRYVGPGTAPDTMEEVQKAINEKLASDGVNLDFSATFIPWDAWDQKINIMISTGEEFELFHVFTNIASYAAKGGLAKLDEFIEQYGPNLKDLFSEQTWEPLKIKGQIYGIPAYWRDITDCGGPIGELGLRKDILEKNNLKIPTNVDEMITVMEIMQKNWGGNDKVYAWDHELKRTPVWLHRTYDSWPFLVDFYNEIYYVDQKANVKSWIETEEFKKDCEVYREMYNKGLIHPDILSLPPDTRTNMANNGNILMGLGTFGYEILPTLNKIDPNYSVETFKLAPEKPGFVFDTLWNMNVVPSTAKHPEAGVMFLNWLYGSEENHNLLIYGIKDKQYKEVGNNRIERVFDSNNKPIYDFPHWQIGYYKMTKFDVSDSEKFIEQYTKSNDKAEYSIAAGFIFNPEPVKTEYANVVAEMTKSIWPIKLGVIDYDKNFPDALKKVKAAGLDKVVAEYDKQLKEWLAYKK